MATTTSDCTSGDALCGTHPGHRGLWRYGVAAHFEWPYRIAYSRATPGGGTPTTTWTTTTTIPATVVWKTENFAIIFLGAIFCSCHFIIRDPPSSATSLPLLAAATAAATGSAVQHSRSCSIFMTGKHS